MPEQREFLSALWQGVGSGFVCARTIVDTGPKESVLFKWPDDIEAICSWTQDQATFLGVGIHDEASPGRSSIRAISAFWNTINLDAVSFDRAVEALKKFPARPSAGVQVDGVLHVFWFLKEVLAPVDFDIAYAANRTICGNLRLGSSARDDVHQDGILKKVGLHASHYDFDGYFRAAGRPGARFVSWHPEIRYTVDEFADLVNPPQAAPTPAPVQAAPAPAAPPPAALDVPEEDRDKIIQAMGENWYEEGRMALHLAGLLAHAGISLDAARAIVCGACRKGGGECERAAKTVEDTYARMAKGENVTGAPALLKAFEPLPEFTKERFKKALEKVKKILPKPPSDGNGENPGPEPDFEIRPPIIKFDSRPARWSVTLEVADGSTHEATCETAAFIAFNLFQAAFYEQTHVMLKDITQFRWKRMIGEAAIETKPTPPEARPEGAIEAALDEFLSEAKEEPDIGVLKTFPGYDEKSKYFRFNAFKVYMKDAGERLDNRMIYDTLKRLKYEPKTKRIGTKTCKVWMREMPGGGNGTADPAPKPPEKVEKKEENEPELFP